jgi:hydroxyethylthiazole kinase-like uncharacterized protein yjeF
MTAPLRDITAAPDLALLTVGQMAASDAAAIAGGVAGTALMAAAGHVAYEAIVNRFAPRHTLVLAGPGNNGGDGWVIAEKLRRAGWPVRVASLVARETLKGDAAWAASVYRGELAPSQADTLDAQPLVIDALYGAGLSRPLDGVARQMVEAVNARQLDCVGIDVPSGLHGDTGQVLGGAPQCKLTVTFFRPKPGHLLLPGRTLCGELVVGEIGIASTVLDAIHPTAFRNGPPLWRNALRAAGAEDHKYTRGAVLIVAGAGMTGAARLAAAAARRMGAGLVSILAPDATTASVLRAGEPGVIVRHGENLAQALSDSRIGAVLLGPGGGVSDELRQNVLAVLHIGRPTVLDADALSVFADNPQALFAAISGPCLLTPHEGEFGRLFRKIDRTSNKLDKARQGAMSSGATVLLKGADTVIADPTGRAVINDNAPPSLATAGSGDVLAGMAVGLLAQGLTPLASGAAAAWLHGAAAERSNRAALIAEDLLTGLAHSGL